MSYYIYILASESGTLYIGVTDNLERRVFEHKNELVEGFSKKYHCRKLIYFEEYKEVIEAITREKQIKGGSRDKKIKLIESLNPSYRDLYTEII